MIGAPGDADYCATKFAVRGCTEVLMAELLESHIQVHLVHPGGIDTNITKGTAAEEESKVIATPRSERSRNPTNWPNSTATHSKT